MNTFLTRILGAAALAAALLANAPRASASQAAPAADDPVARALQLTGSVPVKSAAPYVEIGSYRIWVKAHLGTPSVALPDGTWLYNEFSVADSDVEGTLVVAFKDGKVASMRLVTPGVAIALVKAASSASKIASTH